MKFCKKCGAHLSDDARFCPVCSTQADPVQPEPQLSQADGSVRLCQDGKYRWTYPLDLMKNPSILWIVYKIFGVLLAIPLLVSIIQAALDGDWARAWDNSIKIWVIVIAVFAVIIYLAYLIIVWMYGGQYIVNFTLDEERLVHEQEPAQFERARKLGLLAILVGLFSKRPAAVGQGLFIASHSTSVSELAKVRKIKPRRARHLIKVNEGLKFNQVFVPKEDFDFVLDFLRQHCPNAR